MICAPPIFAEENVRTKQFQQDIEAIEERVKETNVSLEGYVAEGVTLEGTLKNLNNQISVVQKYIGQSKAEISRLSREIGKTQAEIERQLAILRRIVVVLYKYSGASPVELIITAGSFSEYLDNQEQLDRLQAGIAQSVKEIQALKVKLEDEKALQAKVLEEREAQEIVLDAARWEHQQLLAETRRQESVFQRKLKELAAEQERLEAALEKHLASLRNSHNTLGHVPAGGVVGKNGNTGWSTGPHLHIVIHDTGDRNSRYNPLKFIRKHNLVWPMGGSGGWVSQGYRVGHRALDIANREGVPIKAIAAGEMVYRGCVHVGTRHSTFGVFIDHGSYTSYYLHLQAPNNPKYEPCWLNRYRGGKSIDYSLTE